MERLYGVRGRRHVAFPATPGCGRGLAASSATTVGASRSGLQSAPPADIEMLLDARVTEVIDPASFWAQIGEAKTLAEFDSVMMSLGKWCERWGERASLLPEVGEIIAVKGVESGGWMRAKVSRQVSESDVEVFYVDTGATGRVSLGSVCGGSAPQLYSVPKQAFQCSLCGIQPTWASEVWSESSIARFSDLVNCAPVKVKLLQMAGQNHSCTVELYIRRGDKWLSVTELLVAEGLARIQPTGEDAVAHPSTLPGGPEEEGEGVEEEEEVEEGEEKRGGEKCDVSSDPALPTDAKVEAEDDGSVGPVASVEKERGDIFSLTHDEGSRGDAGVHIAQEEGALPASTLNKNSPGHFEHKGPLVVKGLVEQTKEEGTDTACQEREGATEDALSSLDSDEEWDESLLQPLQDILSTSFDSADPFAPPSPDSRTQRRQLNLQAQYNSLMAGVLAGEQRGEREGDVEGKRSDFHHPFTRRGGRGGRSGRRGSSHFQPHRGGYWSGHGMKEGGEWRGGGREVGGERREGEREAGGEWWGKKRGGAGRVGRARRGGRGRPNPRLEQDQSGVVGGGGDVGREGQPGGMRGVKVTTAVRAGGQQQAPTKESSSSVTPPPAPPSKQPVPAPVSTQPVELFVKDVCSATGSKGHETGSGGGQSYPHPGMSAETAKAEVQWHRWKLENHIKKIVGALTAENVNSFGSDIQVLLSTQSSAQKLMSLPGSRGPVWPVLSCLLAEGVKRKDGAEKTILVAFRNLVALLSVDVCQLLQPAVEEMAVDLCEQPSSSEQSLQTKHLFCCLIGKLFLDASYSRNRDYAAVMGRIVRHYLNSWSQCPVECREEQVLTQVQCFSFLCQQIGPTIDITNRETLEQYFGGVVENHILDPKLPRSVRKFLLNLSLKRAAGWRDEGPHSERPPPLAFSQDTPTHSANGQQVVQPIPVGVAVEGDGARPQNAAWNKEDSSIHTDKGVSYPPSSLTYLNQSLPQTSVPSQPPQFQTMYSHSHSVPSGYTMANVPFQSQNSYPQVVPPAGVQQLQNTPPVQHEHTASTAVPPTDRYPLTFPMAYSAVQEMLQSLGLSNHLDNFKRAKISDTVMECGNTDALRGGLKDVGLQPGEVIAVLDYLEKRRRARPSSLTSLHTPPSPYTPHHLPSSPYIPQYHCSSTPSTPNQFPFPTNLTTPPTSQSIQQHSLPNLPVTPQPSLPTNHPATPYHSLNTNLPATPHHSLTNAPQHSLPINHTTTPQQHFLPGPTNHPVTPTFSPSPHQHSTPTHPPLSQFTPSYPAPTRLPTPGPADSTGANPAPNPAIQKYGFGQFSCVLCRSSEHRTEQCPDRDRLFFRSPAILL